MISSVEQISLPARRDARWGEFSDLD